MLDCLILGDNIAHNLSYYRGDCLTVSKDYSNSMDFVHIFKNNVGGVETLALVAMIRDMLLL